ncbi:MAG: SAM-dependent chlorinase/fluorinase [Anaerolineales bacterium]|nr:SAM-dependent chlorinase/fluorinase [Anaerolineales bacterium]
MTVLSITTDFGLTNGFVGVMKGVIYGIAPDVKIVDISHLISAQNVPEGAYAMWRAVPFFPSGSVHIGVVDPGVGTERRPIGARLGDQYFIAPDNGLLTPLILDAKRNGEAVEFVHLDNTKYWLPKVSNTFHGRDIFAPTGAHLAAGVSLRELGTPITDPVRLDMPRPEKTENGWLAHVTIIDIFGNLTTDLPAEALALSPQGEGRRDVLIRIRDHEIDGIVESYGHRQAGDLVAVVDSEYYIEIAVVNGSAARILGAQVGDVVEVIYRD